MHTTRKVLYKNSSYLKHLTIFYKPNTNTIFLISCSPVLELQKTLNWVQEVNKLGGNNLQILPEPLRYKRGALVVVKGKT